MPRKGEGVGDVGRASARQISAPVFGHIQVAVDQRMAQGRDVGEKNTDLAVLDLSGRPAILGSDARRVAAAFGKAAFIQHEDRERRLVPRRAGRGQGLVDQGAQVITHACFVPDGAREQALHAVGPSLSGVFSDLPAIFSGDVAEDGLQVKEGVLADFGARKMGRQPLMHLPQAQCPGANGPQAWFGWRGCGILMMLHAGLLSDGRGN